MTVARSGIPDSNLPDVLVSFVSALRTRSLEEVQVTEAIKTSLSHIDLEQLLFILHAIPMRKQFLLTFANELRSLVFNRDLHIFNPQVFSLLMPFDYVEVVNRFLNVNTIEELIVTAENYVRTIIRYDAYISAFTDYVSPYILISLIKNMDDLLRYLNTVSTTNKERKIIELGAVINDCVKTPNDVVRFSFSNHFALILTKIEQRILSDMLQTHPLFRQNLLLINEPSRLAFLNHIYCLIPTLISSPQDLTSTIRCFHDRDQKNAEILITKSIYLYYPQQFVLLLEDLQTYRRCAMHILNGFKESLVSQRLFSSNAGLMIMRFMHALNKLSPLKAADFDEEVKNYPEPIKKLYQVLIHPYLLHRQELQEIRRLLSPSK